MELRRAACAVLVTVVGGAGLSAVSAVAGLVAAPAGASPPSGPLYAWGSNSSGELGVGENTGPQTCGGFPCSTSPVNALLPSGVTATQTASGDGDSLAIGSDGNAYAWGLNNNGQLGNGSTTATSTPTRVSLPSGVTATLIAAGEFHSLASGSDGHLYAFGANPEGELGNGSTTGSATPVVVSLPSGVTATAIAAGTTTSYAIGSDGHLYIWGENGSGAQRCDPQMLPCSTTPVVVPLPTGVVATAVVGSDFLGLAIGSDNNLYQLNGSATPSTITLPGGVTPTAIASGFADFYASASDGHLYAWGGYNSAGEYGNGTTTISSTPVQVSLPAGVSPTSFAATTYAGYAIGSDGHLYSWGDNVSGQLGIGNSTGPTTVCGFACSTTPVQVSMPSGQLPLALGAEGQAIMAAYVITEPTAPPMISGTPPSPVNANVAYSFAFTLGGVPAPTTTVTSGSLPPGLTLSSNGTISGTPITAGSYTATVTAANGVAPNATDSFTIVVNPTLLEVPSLGPAGTHIAVSGAGFQPAETVKVSYQTGLVAPPKVAVCSATATAAGTINCSGTVPTASAAGAVGAHKLLAKGVTSAIKAKAIFTLTTMGITGVAFTGTTSAPTVTISGKGFGTAPAGTSDNSTPCGPYTNNGDVFGTSFYFIDTGHFSAGQGTAPNGSCVGLIIVSWTNTQIVFQFGNAYDTFDHWFITNGDGYSVQVTFFSYTGTIAI